MSADYHASLDEITKKAEELSEQIAKYKSTSEVVMHAANSLEDASSAIRQLASDARPLAEIQFKRIYLSILGVGALNLVLTLVVLTLVLKG